MMLFNLSGHGFKIAYKEEKQVEPFFGGVFWKQYMSPHHVEHARGNSHKVSQ